MHARYVNNHTHADVVPWKLNLHSLSIRESFLPRKFPTIRYNVYFHLQYYSIGMMIAQVYRNVLKGYHSS